MVPAMTETTTNRVKPELTGWKKALLAGAGVFLVIGLGLQAFGGGGDASADDTVADVEQQDGSMGSEPDGVKSLTGPGHGAQGPGAQGLVQDDSPKIDWPPQGSGDDGSTPDPDHPTGSTDEDEVKAEPGAAGWSPFFLKGGFSFFAAFCVGYATRVWLKMMAFFLGTFLIGIFLLSYAGAIDPNWVKMEGWYDIIVARIESEAVDFKTFLTGSLPQAGLAGLGLVAGFKRK